VTVLHCTVIRAQHSQSPQDPSDPVTMGRIQSMGRVGSGQVQIISSHTGSGWVVSNQIDRVS